MAVVRNALHKYQISKPGRELYAMNLGVGDTNSVLIQCHWLNNQNKFWYSSLQLTYPSRGAPKLLMERATLTHLSTAAPISAAGADPGELGADLLPNNTYRTKSKTKRNNIKSTTQRVRNLARCKGPNCLYPEEQKINDQNLKPMLSTLNFVSHRCSSQKGGSRAAH